MPILAAIDPNVALRLSTPIAANTQLVAATINTTETELWSTTLSAPVAAGLPAIWIRARGIVTRSGSGPSIRMRIRAGTGTLTNRAILCDSGAIVTSVGGSTNDLWLIDAMLAIRAAGAAGTIFPQGLISHVTSGSALVHNAFTSAATVRGGSTAAISVDTSGDITLSITVEYSANTAGNTIDITNCEAVLI